MPGNLMTGTSARDIGYNVVQALCGRVTGAGADVAVKIGTLPAGAVITAVSTNVETAITGTAPVFSIGTASGGAQLASAVALTAGSLNTVPIAALVQPLAADTDVWAGITGGGATTAGDAYVMVQFVKPLT
jgi:hypothetical protein